MGWSANVLSFARDERVLLATIGFATFGIVSSVLAVLTTIRDTNEIQPAQPKTQYITQETEDSLQLETIEKLLNHPNFSIKEVAVKILCDRALNDEEVLHQLLYGITSLDYDHRMKCLRALALLTGQSVGLDGLSKLNKPKAYSALVRSLELSITDGDLPDLTDSHWDEYYLRDMTERFCLMFILELINKYGVTALIKAKFIEKWLARQDWGETREERCRNFKDYLNLKTNRIVDIVNRIKHTRRGLKTLEKVGLIEKDQSRGGMRQEIMEIEEDTTGAPPAEQQIPRNREHSAEEQRLRRQHREAMVLNDGTRPLGRDDIIERDHSPLQI